MEYGALTGEAKSRRSVKRRLVTDNPGPSHSPVAIIMEAIVAGHCDERAPCRPDRVKDLHSSLGPHLATDKRS